MIIQNSDIRILIIDDDARNVAFINEILILEQIKLDIVKTWENAELLLNSKLYSLILLNINQTNVNGLEICNALKNTNNTSSIPIIIITQTKDNNLISEAFKAGANDYLLEPYGKLELITKITTQLQKTFYEQHIKEYSNQIEKLVELQENQYKKQNDHLLEQNTILKNNADAINKQLKVKKLYLTEIHHLVKNYLQLIISIINFQIRQTSNPEAINVQTEIQQRIYSIALVHEKFMQSEEFTINFALYIRNLVDYLSKNFSQQNIIIEYQLDEIYIDMEKSIVCGLIINELIQNALKYAFINTESPKLFIQYRKIESEKILLCVSDNGIGCEYKNRNIKGIGLELIHSLIEQLSGEYTIDNTNGTKYSIIFSNLSNDN